MVDVTLFIEDDEGDAGRPIGGHNPIILHPVACTIASCREGYFAIFVIHCADLVAANYFFWCADFTGSA